MKIIKSILTSVLVIVVAPALTLVLTLVGMVIGSALLMLPGVLIGDLVFDDFPPTWYLIIFAALPGGIGMFTGLNFAIEGLSSTDLFKKADRNIYKADG